MKGSDKNERGVPPPRSFACLTLAAAGAWLVLTCLGALLELLNPEVAFTQLTLAGLLLALAVGALALC